ncbi:MAG: hypothetical protein AAFQ58_02590 [Pseudomonadota bacterium]
MKHILLGLSALVLAACAETTTVNEGTFTFGGKSYRTTTQEFTTATGTFQRRRILVGAQRVSCSATDDADCVLAIIEATKSSSDRGA